MAHRYRFKYPELGDPTEPFSVSMSENGVDFDWITYLSKGGLITPSDSLIHAARIMEACFLLFYGEDSL